MIHLRRLSNKMMSAQSGYTSRIADHSVLDEGVLFLRRHSIRDLEYSKIPFIMFSYCKKGGIAYEDINFGSKWCVV